MDQIVINNMLSEGWIELKDGQTVSPKIGDRFFVSGGGSVNITGQTGGDCWSLGSSTLNSTGQTGDSK